MKKIICSMAFVAATLLFYSNAQAQEDTNAQSEYDAKLKIIKEKIHPRTGIIQLPAVNATLSPDDKYYYINPQESDYSS